MPSVHYDAPMVDPVRAALAEIDAMHRPGVACHPDSIEWQIHHAMLEEFFMLRLGDDAPDDAPAFCQRCGAAIEPGPILFCSYCFDGVGPRDDEPMPPAHTGRGPDGSFCPHCGVDLPAGTPAGSLCSGCDAALEEFLLRPLTPAEIAEVLSDDDPDLRKCTRCGQPLEPADVDLCRRCEIGLDSAKGGVS